MKSEKSLRFQRPIAQELVRTESREKFMTSRPAGQSQEGTRSWTQWPMTLISFQTKRESSFHSRNLTCGTMRLTSPSYRMSIKLILRSKHSKIQPNIQEAFSEDGLFHQRQQGINSTSHARAHAAYGFHLQQMMKQINKRSSITTIHRGRRDTILNMKRCNLNG